jgi:hypothetical protein
MARLREIGEALPLPRTAMRNRLMADPPGLEPGFVAHEFLTAHWRPVFQADLARDVAAAKLEFVGSANLFETLPGLFCDAEQMSLMGRMGDAMEPREFLKDLCLPRHFRADVFIRGARPLAQLAALDDIALAACRDLPADTPPLNTGASKVALQQGVWEVIAARLAAGPIRLGALRQGLGEGAPHPAEILALLVGTDHALPYFRDAGPQPAATRFNIAAAAIHAANGEGEGQLALAAPHALGGIAASATELALVGQLLQGADPARPAWMAAQLQPGLADAALELATARIAELLADRFPVWRRFGVV